MKLTHIIVERINGRSDIKKALINEFRIDRSTLLRWIRDNEPNGPLTRLRALEIIASMLNEPIESVLEKEASAVA